MLEEMVDNMPKKSSLTYTCLAHDDNRDIEAYSLHHEAHLEEVIDVYNISFLAIYLVVPIS